MKKNKFKTVCNCIIFITLMFSVSGFSQMSLNTNKAFGGSFQGTSIGSNSADWLFSVIRATNSNIIAGGYTKMATSPFTKYPTVIAYSSGSTLLWETNISCMEGLIFDVFEVSNGYLVFGQGIRTNACALDPTTLFSVLLDKSTGALNNQYGVKYYNYQTLSAIPIPQNGLNHTRVGSLQEGQLHGCMIKNQSGQPTGFMLCANFEDRSYPSTYVQSQSTGAFLLKLGIDGNPDISFGNGGVMIYKKSTSVSTQYNAHFHNVCVNYDVSGSILGYAIVGSLSENPAIVNTTLGGDFDNDAWLLFVDQSGNTVYEDVFDETTRNKNTGTPSSYIYTDQSDISLCSGFAGYPSQENNNQRAVRIKQIAPGGDFIVLTEFDWTYWLISGSCTAMYPNSGFGVVSDPALLRIDWSGNIVWTKNTTQCSGIDYNVDLAVTPSDIFVLGCTRQDPQPTPTDERATLSKISTSGGMIYERVYNETSGGQNHYCPFSITEDSGNNEVIIAGDNNLNGDDYQILIVSPY